MFRYGKLRTRLVVFCLALSVPPFAALGLLAIHQNRMALERAVCDHLESLALKHSHALSVWLRERKNDLGMMSDACLLEPGHRDEMVPWLRRVEDAQPYYQGIFVLDETGAAVFSTRPEFREMAHSSKKYFRRAMAGETFVSDPYWDKALAKPAIMLAAPLPRNEEIVGAIVARADLREVDSIVGGIRPGQTGEGFVIDSRGTMITDSRFRRDAALRESVAVPDVESLFAEQKLAVRRLTDYRGKEALVAFSSIPEQKWALVVKQDTDEAYSSAHQLTVYWGAGLLAGLVAVTAVSFLLARSVSAPLAALVRSAEQIGRGELEHRTPTQGADEVAELARAFNEMVGRLQASQRSLEENQEQLAAAKTRLQALYTVDHQQLENLHEITKALSSTLDLDVVLRTVLQNVVSHLDASHGAIRLTEEVSISPGKSTSAVRTVRKSDGAAPAAVPEELESRLVQQVTKTREPLLIPQAGVGAERAPGTPICSAMFAPLAAGDECQGAIHVTRTGGDKLPFQQDDLRFLCAVAIQAAVAIQNARLYQAERRHRRELEEARGRLDRLLDQVLTAQEAERRRVALELHDGPAQSMATILRSLELCAALTDGDGERARTELQRLQSQVRGDLSEMRRLINDLRPTLLDSLGFMAAVRQYCRDFEDDSGVATRLDVTGEERELDGRLATTLFRILQEALSNVRKHADAPNVSVQLAYEDDNLRVTVTDDGKGFSVGPSNETNGDRWCFGLLGMRERAELLGGTLDLESTPGEGATVTLNVHLEDARPVGSAHAAVDHEC